MASAEAKTCRLDTHRRGLMLQQFKGHVKLHFTNIANLPLDLKNQLNGGKCHVAAHRIYGYERKDPVWRMSLISSPFSNESR
jgi:hypothetical protein